MRSCINLNVQHCIGCRTFLLRERWKKANLEAAMLADITEEWCSIDFISEEIAGISEDEIKKYFIDWLSRSRSTIWLRAAIEYRFPQYKEMFEKLAILI